MSHRAVRWVLEESPAAGASRLVHLVLAERSNEASGKAWPSLSTLAREAGIDRSTAAKAVKWLKARDLIEQTGTSGAGTTEYRLLMRSASGETPLVATDHRGSGETPLGGWRQTTGVVATGHSTSGETPPEPEGTVSEPETNQVGQQEQLVEVAALNGHTVEVVERFKLVARTRKAKKVLVVDVGRLCRVLTDFSHLPDLRQQSIACAEWLGSDAPKAKQRQDAPRTLRAWLERRVNERPKEVARERSFTNIRNR